MCTINLETSVIKSNILKIGKWTGNLELQNVLVVRAFEPLSYHTSLQIKILCPSNQYEILMS